MAHVQCGGEGQSPTKTVPGFGITMGDCPACGVRAVVRKDGTIPKHKDLRSPKRRREDEARRRHENGDV